VLRRWCCCLIRWRHDLRKSSKSEAWRAYRNAGYMLLTHPLSCWTSCVRYVSPPPPIIQPRPGPAGLPHVWQCKK
jgi:hypothetical protein